MYIISNMDPLYRQAIEQKLVEAIATGVEQGQVQESQLPEISNYILSHLDKITTHDQLIGILSHLALKWPVFRIIATEEEGKLKQVVEKNVAKDVLRLINKGHTKQAVSLAQKITKN